MTANRKTILTTIAFLSLAVAIISYWLSKSVDAFSYLLRGALIAFILCVVLLKE